MLTLFNEIIHYHDEPIPCRSLHDAIARHSIYGKMCCEISKKIMKKLHRLLDSLKREAILALI